MSKVLILSKTKMQEDRVCVGGVDLDNRCSIRLLDRNGHHETINKCPYELLSIWEVEYTQMHRRPAPHLEDVKVTRRRDTKNVVSPTELLKLPNYNIRIYNNSPIQETFAGKLLSTDGGSFYISRELGVPNFSTCFWVCDKTLTKSRRTNSNKVKFTYRDDEDWFQITYVGVEKAPERIPKGSLVRLSLAHWWSPEDSDTEERCYLQLSGFFKLEEQEDIEISNSANKASSSQEITFSLFQKGMSVEQIADNRGLSQSTIYNHLIGYVASGKINIKRLISEENIKRVDNFYRENPEETHLKPCYEHFNETVSYDEIKLIRAYLNRN